LAIFLSVMILPKVVRGEDELQYNRDVRPILVENCFACHGADSAARKADLRLDQREPAIDFGAITPGEPDDSELIARVVTDDVDLLMPPPETKKKLSAEEIDILRRWIVSGAEYQPHWSFIAPQPTPPPAVKNEGWVKQDIDRFVLARLEAVGLSPAAEADPRSLFRRVHLDITGLPPADTDVASFVTDFAARGDAALSDWIDRLMSTQAWGEHRARYWLDAARYADTHGIHFDNYREMWPYRDWVIRSFNANQPFDQFTIEQLAGDLLENPSDDQLIATGFQRCNMTTNEGGTIAEENLANYAVDRVQTFGWVYMGLTTNCAQCHDHKFDPISIKDYYSLAAFFRNTTQGAMDGNVKDGLGPAMVVPSDQDRPRWKELPGLIAQAQAERDERKAAVEQAAQLWFASQTNESLATGLPADKLLLHLPLDEGQGNQVRAHVASDGPDSPPSFAAGGDIQWQPDGPLGSAPVIQRERTFDLGGLADFEQNQRFSFGAWIKPSADNRAAAILARMDESAAYRGWDLFQNGKSFAVHLIDAWPGNSIKVTTKDELVKAGQWQHVFVTYNGSGRASGVRIYVDGELKPVNAEQNSLQLAASIKTNTPLRIGSRSNGSVFADSAIQDVRIYERTLSAADVRKLADYAELRSALAASAEQRTPEQQASIFEYYLATQDQPFLALKNKLKELERERKQIQDRSPVTHIQVERQDSPAMAHILIRGEYDQPSDQVTAAPPAALHPLPKGAPPNRLGLARWVVDPANPLTARVTVNRFWQQLFGTGLVATSEDFGVVGELPSHPQLLDFMAIDFQSSGWDVKRFFKQVLLSATYRQNAQVTAEKLELDPDNRLLSRGPRFRMDAEMVRDYALATSGLLSPTMYGPGVKPYQPEAIWSIVGLPGGDTREYKRSEGQDLYRRSIYSFWKRMAPPPSLEAFNAPSREVCSVRRERTNTPLQALVTLNDPQFVEAARYLAAQAISSADVITQRLDVIALRVLGRPLTPAEQAVLAEDLQVFSDYYSANQDSAEALVRVGESPVDPNQDLAQLAAWTMICNQILNLDEALNK
jgi:cytochrome c553